MANICETVFHFYGNADEIKKFHQLLKKWTTENLCPNGWGTGFLGNVLCGAGLGKYVDDLKAPFSYGGEIVDITDIDEKGNTASFEIYVDSKYHPMAKMWVAVIRKLNLSVRFSFQATEPGVGIYEIYDPENIKFFDKDGVYVDALIDRRAINKYPFLADFLDWFQDGYTTDTGMLLFLKEHGLSEKKDGLEYKALKALDLPSSYVVAHGYETIKEIKA